MKTTRYLILSWLATAFLCQAQQPLSMVRQNVSFTQHATANAAKQAQLAAQGQMQKTLSPQTPQFNVPATPIAEVITPDIQSLADGLQDDPLRIFNYVHDHIRHVLYFGSRKGAELTLLEKSGNDFDQCALLVALLNAAGYTNTGYQFGWMELPYDSPDHQDLHHWLQLNVVNTNWNTTANYLGTLIVSARGYPMALSTFGTNIFAFQRIWVTLTNGATTYYLDPSFKVSEPISGINIAAATGFSSNALMSAAGGLSTSDYVTNLNETALRSALTGYTTNLLNYIQSNCPNASVAQVLSGWQIVPSTNTTLPTSLLFTTVNPGGTMPILNWTYEPTDLMSELGIWLEGQSWSGFYMPQLEGQRLCVTFDTNNFAELWLDDNLQNWVQFYGTAYLPLELIVHHPVGYWDTNNNVFVDVGAFDQSYTEFYLDYGSTYNIVYGFEPDWGWLQARQRKLDVYRHQGFSDDSQPVVSETLNVMGLNYLLESWYTEQILAAQSGVLPENNHFFGRLGQEAGNGYYLDIFGISSSDAPSGGMDDFSIDQLNRCEDMVSYFGSSLEHGVLEQLQPGNLTAVSTMKLLQLANTNGQAIFLANSNNWSTIQGQLSNYSSSDLSSFSYLTSSGHDLLLPQNGSNTLGSWSGYGYVNYAGPGTIGTIIQGTYYGGDVTFPTNVSPPYVDTNGLDQPYKSGTNDLEPVDMLTGAFQLNDTDLSLGRAEPRGITLTRSYDSTRLFNNPSGMGPGWVNNFCTSAQAVAAPRACLGDTTPAQCAAMIAATCAALGTYSDSQPDPKNWTVAALIAKWAIDQLYKTGISIETGQDTVQFVRQPDGSFTPPANTTMTLTQNGSAYSLQKRHGNTFNFDSLGRLSTIVDQYGETLNITYSTNILNLVQMVTDWKNRSLMFNYSGALLSSVSDSAGRSVSYGYSAQGDLVSVTYPENKTWSFAYNTNHQIIATFDAYNQVIVSNIYDNYGRVATQYVEGDTNKVSRAFWSGWQTVAQDPAGGQKTYFYDDKQRQTGFLDALGNFSQTFYDGQDHVVTTISPLNETNQSVYDGFNNVIQTIDPLGFTNQFVYDGQFNLIRSVDTRGNASTFGYNPQFSLTGRTNGAGDYVNYTYNSDGTRATRTDSGGTTSYGFDSYGQLDSITYPGGLGGESFVNNTLGDLTSHTDANGNTTTFGYNNRRQLTNSITPTNVVTSISYDADGRIGRIMDARGNVTSSTWDVMARLLATVLPATPQGVPIITNTYDGRGWLAKSVDPLHNTTFFTNDLVGRLVVMTDPLMRTKVFGYDADGRKVTTVNAANETNSQTWDARGSLLNLTDGAGHTSSQTYDSVGNRITLTNRNGQKWQFQFDGANRLTNTITPLGRSTALTFNHQGLVSTMKDPAGRTTTYAYDAKGRLTSRADDVANTTYGYDANNNLTNEAEPGLTNSWTLDAYNRVSSYKDAYGNLIQYRYDANGNLTNLIYPGNRVVAYAYDGLNRLTNVTDWANRQTVLTYDLASNLKSITRPNGTVREMNYDAAGELTNIVEQTAGNLPIAVLVHGWNAASEMNWEFAAPLQHESTVPTRTMTYNDDNELSTVDGNGVTVDLNGNLTGGPLTNDTAATYIYDARNRLLNVGGVTNVYDSMNNRIGQTRGSNTTIYVVNPNARLSQVLMRIKNGVTNYYIYGAGLLYQVTETTTGTNMLTYHFDYRGSTVALTDGSGNVTDRMEYSLYATSTYRSGTNDTPFLFNGRYGVQADANGLLYMRARYYSPYLCRWPNPDPMGFGAGLNFYVFVGNNPVNRIDPLGLEYQITIGIGGTFGATGVIGLPTIAGGVSVGFTTSGQLIFQGTSAQMNDGIGAFGGGGISLTISHTKCPTPYGKSTSNAGHAEANLGYIYDAGLAVDFAEDGSGVSFPIPKGKLDIGVGYGGMAGYGYSSTTTYATPPIPQITGTIYTSVTYINNPPNNWTP